MVYQEVVKWPGIKFLLGLIKILLLDSLTKNFLQLFSKSVFSIGEALQEIKYSSRILCSFSKPILFDNNLKDL